MFFNIPLQKCIHTTKVSVRCVCVRVFTFGRVSMVAGAISVSIMSCFSMDLFLVGVELFLFFRDGDGVPSSMQADEKQE